MDHLQRGEEECERVGSMFNQFEPGSPEKKKRKRGDPEKSKKVLVRGGESAVM